MPGSAGHASPPGKPAGICGIVPGGIWNICCGKVSSVCDGTPCRYIQNQSKMSSNFHHASDALHMYPQGSLCFWVSYCVSDRLQVQVYNPHLSHQEEGHCHFSRHAFRFRIYTMTHISARHFRLCAYLLRLPDSIQKSHRWHREGRHRAGHPGHRRHAKARLCGHARLSGHPS